MLQKKETYFSGLQATILYLTWKRERERNYKPHIIPNGLFQGLQIHHKQVITRYLSKIIHPRCQVHDTFKMIIKTKEYEHFLQPTLKALSCSKQRQLFCNSLNFGKPSFLLGSATINTIPTFLRSSFFSFP